MTHRKSASQTRFSALARLGQRCSPLARIITLCLMAFSVLGLSSPIAHAQTYIQQTVHNFDGTNLTDGYAPRADMIEINGIFYGTTSNGGPGGIGAIFSFDPTTNTETPLYKFPFGGNDGSTPYAGLINVNGILYGTTRLGGVQNKGTIFSFDLSTHTETVLYSFGTTANAGVYPQAGLTAVNGVLYGTTTQGGASSDGMVFSINPDGTGFKIIHSFRGSPTDGSFPVADLINLNGVLYGTTQADGTIFSLDTTTNTYQVVYTFQGSDNNDGLFPSSELININGILYGTTSLGGAGGYDVGTIFSFDPTTNTETVLYSFKNITGDGQEPVASLTYDSFSGKLFGTTQYGGHYQDLYGPNYSAGTVFSFDLNTHKEEVVYSFNDYNAHTDGTNPLAGLIDLNGTLYGTASDGGSIGTGYGTIFSLTPAPPVGHSDSGTDYYNTTLVISAPGVLGNDDNDGNPMTATLLTNPTHGTLTFHTDGSFTYVPNTGYLGTDSFTYAPVNSIGTGSPVTVTLTIKARTPVAANDSGRTAFNTPMVITAPGVLGNDNPGNTGTLTAALVTNPSHGTITFHSDGSFTYVPTAGFLGTDSFTYQDTNSIGTSNVATCTLLVQARTPIAVNDHGTVNHNTTATFAAPAVLGNDNPGTNTGVTAAIVTNPSHGTITFHSDGSFVYTPTAGFIGTDSFTYKDTNAIGTSNTATCTLTVQ